jgi:hypothetical protein
MSGVLALALTFGATGFVFSADFPGPIEKGDVLINGGFGIGMYGFTFKITGGIGNYVIYENPLLVGGYVSVDFALPINFPLTLGLETGFSGASIHGVYHSSIPAPDGSLGFIPILARIAWHPDFGVAKLDPFFMFKLGYGFGWLGGGFGDLFKPKGPAGFGIGLKAGLRYFFTDNFGIFFETGYDGFFADFDYDVTIHIPPSTSIAMSGPWNSPVQTFLTLGITYKP